MFRLAEMIKRHVNSMEVSQIEKLRNAQVLITYTIVNLVDQVYLSLYHSNTNTIIV